MLTDNILLKHNWHIKGDQAHPKWKEFISILNKFEGREYWTGEFEDNSYYGIYEGKIYCRASYYNSSKELSINKVIDMFNSNNDIIFDYPIF